MSHARQQIREACAALVTGLATTGSRVFQSRMAPQDSLPCLLVTTNDEDIAEGAFDAQYERNLSVSVVGLAKAGATLDDTLDQIALEVETAMVANRRFILSGIEVDFDEGLEKPAGRIVLTYRARYFTDAGAPGIIL